MKRKTIVGVAVACLLSLAGPALASSNTGATQQYLHKTPDGYCGPDGTGVACPLGPGVRRV